MYLECLHQLKSLKVGWMPCSENLGSSTCHWCLKHYQWPWRPRQTILTKEEQPIQASDDLFSELSSVMQLPTKLRKNFSFQSSEAPTSNWLCIRTRSCKRSDPSRSKESEQRSVPLFIETHCPSFSRSLVSGRAPAMVVLVNNWILAFLVRHLDPFHLLYLHSLHLNLLNQVFVAAHAKRNSLDHI